MSNNTPAQHTLCTETQMTTADRHAVWKHTAYMANEKAVVSLRAKLPDAGFATIHRDGTVTTP